MTTSMSMIDVSPNAGDMAHDVDLKPRCALN